MILQKHIKPINLQIIANLPVLAPNKPPPDGLLEPNSPPDVDVVVPKPAEKEKCYLFIHYHCLFLQSFCAV